MTIPDPADLDRVSHTSSVVSWRLQQLEAAVGRVETAIAAIPVGLVRQDVYDVRHSELEHRITDLETAAVERTRDGRAVRNIAISAMLSAVASIIVALVLAFIQTH